MTEQTDENSDNGESVKTVAEYLEAIKKLTINKYGKYAFRGQGKKSYPISSSAARRLKIINSDPDETERLNDYNKKLISDAMLKGYHRNGNMPLVELELLAELQHNGAATGLIDFTYSSLVALYFAASDMDEEDAAVHIINTSDTIKYRHIQSDNLSETFEAILKKSKGKLWIWEPSNLNNRIPKQHSIFIFGEPVIDEELKIKIDKEAKSQIISELKNYHNIEPLTLFDDLTGFAKENNYEKPYYTDEYLNLMNKIIFNYCSSFLNKDYENVKIFDWLNDAIKIKPDSYEARIIRSHLNNYMKNHSKSIEDYDILIKLYPNASEVYFFRGKAKYHLNRLEEAKIDFEKSLKLDPNNDTTSKLLKITKERISND